MGLGGCKGRIVEAATCIKSTGILPATLLSDGIDDCILALDHKAFNNGVTIAFSRKTARDPYSRCCMAHSGAHLGTAPSLSRLRESPSPLSPKARAAFSVCSALVAGLRIASRSAAAHCPPVPSCL